MSWEICVSYNTLKSKHTHTIIHAYTRLHEDTHLKKQLDMQIYMFTTVRVNDR